jgi:hypothetical protein
MKKKLAILFVIFISVSTFSKNRDYFEETKNWPLEPTKMSYKKKPFEIPYLSEDNMFLKMVAENYTWRQPDVKKFKIVWKVGKEMSMEATSATTFKINGIERWYWSFPSDKLLGEYRELVFPVKKQKNGEESEFTFNVVYSSENNSDNFQKYRIYFNELVGTQHLDYKKRMKNGDYGFIEFIFRKEDGEWQVDYHYKNVTLEVKEEHLINKSLKPKEILIETKRYGFKKYKQYWH